MIICDEVVDSTITLSVAGLMNDNGTGGSGPGGCNRPPTPPMLTHIVQDRHLTPSARAIACVYRDYRVGYGVSVGYPRRLSADHTPMR